jgi:hypothetical protein
MTTQGMRQQLEWPQLRRQGIPANDETRTDMRVNVGQIAQCRLSVLQLC